MTSDTPACLCAPIRTCGSERRALKPLDLDFCTMHIVEVEIGCLSGRKRGVTQRICFNNRRRSPAVDRPVDDDGESAFCLMTRVTEASPLRAVRRTAETCLETLAERVADRILAGAKRCGFLVRIEKLEPWPRGFGC